MTVVNPAWALASQAQLPATWRRGLQAQTLNQPGVFVNQLSVTQRGTPNMSVDVADGACIVAGSEAPATQGYYLCQNDGVQNVPIAASGVLPRLDLIVARIRDAQYSGGTSTWALEAITGTPAAVPLFPARPANTLVLATVSVAASSTTVLNAAITDIRNGSTNDGSTTLTNRGWATMAGGRVSVLDANNRPTGSALYEGLEIYQRSNDATFTWNGAAWIPGLSYTSGTTWVTALTQGVAVTHTIQRAAYGRIGRRVIGECHITATASGTNLSLVTVNLPLTSATSVSHIVGSGVVIDADTGGLYPVTPYLLTTTTVAFIRTSVEATSAIYLGSSGLTQLATGDVVSFTFSYEAV